MVEYEWGTQAPDGPPIKWSSEDQARRIGVMSQTFDNGEHKLVRRRVGPWIPVEDESA